MNAIKGSTNKPDFTCYSCCSHYELHGCWFFRSRLHYSYTLTLCSVPKFISPWSSAAFYRLWFSPVDGISCYDNPPALSASILSMCYQHEARFGKATGCHSCKLSHTHQQTHTLSCMQAKPMTPTHHNLNHPAQQLQLSLFFLLHHITYLEQQNRAYIKIHWIIVCLSNQSSHPSLTHR